jgi:hypothetical protein
VDLLKFLPTSGLDRLLAILNACVAQGVVPSGWLEGLITLILKKGRDETLLESYRPITLLSSLWKTLERILLRRLTGIVRPGIVDEQGWGFRGRGTPEQLFSLSEAAFQSPAPLFACFLDIKEAFDSVWVEKMLVQLANAGADAHSWRLIQGWYKGYSARVRKGPGISTDAFDIGVGTRQGSVLSPLLFAIFINDLALNLRGAAAPGAAGRPVRPPLGLPLRAPSGSLTSIQCLLYGDDVVLLASSEAELQILVDIAAEFASSSRLRFSLTKCACMQLGPLHSCPPSLPISLQGSPLPWVPSYTYLGLMFSAGPDPFHLAVLSRCAAALESTRAYAALASTRSSNSPAVESRGFYLAHVASARDYALPFVRLSDDSWAALLANEAACLAILRCGHIVRGADRIHCRFANRRRSFNRKIAGAPRNSWRALLGHWAPAPSFLRHTP